MPKLSVIVPVYNSKDFLPACIDSILQQTFKGFELLLIDDGSTDGSSMVCDRYAEGDRRIRVIHQKNGGAAKARNMGITKAKGTYLAFVDSDDVINRFMLERLMNGAEYHSADIAMIRITRDLNEFSKYAKDSVSLNWNEMGKEEIYSKLFGSGAEDWCYLSVCGKVYKRQLCNGIKFEGTYTEDGKFNSRLYHHAEKIISCQAPFYYWRVNTQSVTHRAFNAERVKNIEAYGEMYRFLSSKRPDLAGLCLRKWYKIALGVRNEAGRNPEFWHCKKDITVDLRKNLGQMVRAKQIPVAEKGFYVAAAYIPGLYSGFQWLMEKRAGRF